MKVNVDREESSASPSTPALWEFVCVCQHTHTRGASSHILSTDVRDASSHDFVYRRLREVSLEGRVPDVILLFNQEVTHERGTV